MPDQLPQWQSALLQRHGLSVAYLHHALKWFAPLAERLARHQSGAGQPLLVALNGCQGSGKTTVCDYLRALLAADHGCRVVTLSLDDFYLTRTQRASLARSVHPLLATRGVPGTHDMELLEQTLDALLAPSTGAAIPIPRFDKALDDRCPRSSWDQVVDAVDLVLLEGWCLGARPQTAEELLRPVNALERDEDPEGTWRGYANGILARDFRPLHRRVASWVMLRAPSFDCVYRWRLEQEQKLAASAAPAGPDRIMDAAQLSRFIQYYERLTGQCLEQMPQWVDHLFTLDDQRRVIDYRQRRRARP